MTADITQPAIPQPASLPEAAPAKGSRTAHAHGQQHPIGVYLKVWGYLFVLSTLSYLVDYFQLEGALRWTLILAFMVLKAGLIVEEGVRPWGNPLGAPQFGSCFFMITGFHGLHLIGGLTVWGRTTVKVLGGSPAAEVRLSVDLCAVYWHFLLLVWLVMFAVLLST
jgi:hypothetical protein